MYLFGYTDKNPSGTKARKIFRIKIKKYNNALKVGVISTLIVMLILAPFSPIIDHSNLYKTNLPISKYSKLYQEFSTEIKLIPLNTPYVVIGDSE